MPKNTFLQPLSGVAFWTLSSSTINSTYTWYFEFEHSNTPSTFYALSGYLPDSLLFSLRFRFRTFPTGGCLPVAFASSLSSRFSTSRFLIFWSLARPLHLFSRSIYIYNSRIYVLVFLFSRDDYSSFLYNLNNTFFLQTTSFVSSLQTGVNHHG